MIETRPVDSYEDIARRFPGIETGDPLAMGRLAFHAAAHVPEINGTEEDYESWQDYATESLRDARDWSEGWAGDRSRLGIAMAIQSDRQAEIDSAVFVKKLESMPLVEAFNKTLQYAKEQGYKVVADQAPGPMTPEGRARRIPLEEYLYADRSTLITPYAAKIEDESGRSLDPEVESFIGSKHQAKMRVEKIQTTISETEKISEQEIDSMRRLYGSKAAMLLLFEARADSISAVTGGEKIVSIPDLTAVSVDMYEAWKTDKDLFTEMLDLVKQEAMQLIDHPYEKGLIVAIRSSAVNSEDGTVASGAGIYESRVADPSNYEEFLEAIEAVYESVGSPNAVKYRKQLGIDTEQMGLVIQVYSEAEAGNRRDGPFYGYSNSLGANPNLIEVHTNRGSLLYDKALVKDNLLIDSRGEFHEKTQLHTNPERKTDLEYASSSVRMVPHAAILAEMLFERPMQIEFLNGDIVQVRPLINVDSISEKIEFPDEDSIAELAGVGVGDMILDVLPEGQDNSEKEGLVVFDREYGFTIRGGVFNNADYGVHEFPKKGAVLIMDPHTNGHIQTIAREKGLICIYPFSYDKNREQMSKLVDAVWGVWEGGTERRERVHSKFRVVSDGYKAGIYTVDE